jgi:hypothetical protein
MAELEFALTLKVSIDHIPSPSRTSATLHRRPTAPFGWLVDASIDTIAVL